MTIYTGNRAGRRHRLCLAGAALLLSSFVSVLPVFAQGRGFGAKPEVLPRSARGAEAIALLGSRLPQVAQEHGLTKSRLASLFQNDPTLEVDKTASLLYVEEGLPAGTGSASDPQFASAMCPGHSLADAFNLESKPGAPLTIYIDFNGHFLTGTVWNSNYLGGASLQAPPWTLDGDASTFNDQERSAILEIWCRVAEDFRPFNVNVTTKLVSEDQITRSNSSDLQYGTRALVSPFADRICTGCGGYAYVGIFSHIGDYYKPALIFPERLLNGSKYIAEAVSHEVGHNLDLNHDGASGTSYYAGHGSGATGWAPIMGNSYYQNLTQWSKGEYAGATERQDDLAVISSFIPFRTDDHGDTPSNATALSISSGFVTAVGTIQGTSDVDMWRLTVGSGTIDIEARPEILGPNLLLKLSLRNSNNQVISEALLSSGLNARLSSPVASGVYYLAVDGVAYGDPATNGFSEYASLGNYDFSVTYTTSGGQSPPAALAVASPGSGDAPITVQFTGSGSTDFDGSIVSYQWTFGDGGTSDIANPSHQYVSPGSYEATLTVTDNDGLTGSMTVVVNVTAPNVPPTAAFTASATSGSAPLAVQFDGRSSSDPDGTISSYVWNFGDGTGGSGATPSKTFSNPGTYTVTLTVTDNRGATALTSRTIQVQGIFRVSTFTVQKTKKGKTTTATASIVITSPSGSAVPLTAISGQWITSTGAVASSVTGQTDNSGRASFTWKNPPAGAVTFRITVLSKPNFALVSTQTLPMSATAQ